MSAVLVYAITFADSVYIGQTVNLPDRMIAHATPSGHCNARLYTLLNSGSDYGVDIISRHRTRDAATCAERKAIRRYRGQGFKIINRFTPGREGAELAQLRAAENRDGRGWIRCSLCHRRYPTECFHPDSSRHNGLHSKCRFCSRMCDRLAKRDGSGGWARSREMIVAWRDDGYKGLHPCHTGYLGRPRKNRLPYRDPYNPHQEEPG